MSSKFKSTTHLSEIVENSYLEPIIIFKYSTECGSSERLLNKFELAFEAKDIKSPVYVVVVQDHKVLSKKIEELLEIKHESPQVIILNKGKVTYSSNHDQISIPDFKFI
jgi:bacillithiol system protein YtxJ